MRGEDTSGVGRSPLIDTDRKLVTVPGGGKYTEAALAGRLFYAANINMVVTSVSLATAFVGLGLCNPTGSGKIVIVHEFGYAVVVAPVADGILALATTTDSGFADDTNAPIKCTRDGYATSVCYTDEGATIVAPVITKIITQFSVAATTTISPKKQLVDLEGSIILVPGRSVVTDTTTAMNTAGSQFSFMWEEIDE